MPNARRVIFGTHIVPTRVDTMEGDSIPKSSFQASPGKTLGGKGIAAIDATQWNDAWTSMFHTQVNWEDLTDTADTTGNRWEDSYEPWNGTLILGTSSVQLTTDTSDCGFLYIKNTGFLDTAGALVGQKDVQLFLNGDDTDSAYIVIPPQGSVCLRGTTDLQCNEILVKAEHSDGAIIEWIIAQLTR